MKDMKEYQAELHQRVALECRTQKQQRRRVLALCLPLALCLAVGALTLPPLLKELQKQKSAGELSENMEQDGLPAGNGAKSEGPILAEGGAPAEGQTQQKPPAQDVVETDSSASGKSDGPVDEASGVPADFAFRFTWGCYGVSSYDSESERLVKTSDSTHPEDYVTSLGLDGQQRRRAWLLLSQLDWAGYPAEYDPYNAPDSDSRVASEPSQDLVLWFRAQGEEHSVSCRGICLEGGGIQGYDAKARTFLQVCDRLTELLTGTPEWQALPDYEFYYE